MVRRYSSEGKFLMTRYSHWCYVTNLSECWSPDDGGRAVGQFGIRTYFGRRVRQAGVITIHCVTLLQYTETSDQILENFRSGEMSYHWYSVTDLIKKKIVSLNDGYQPMSLWVCSPLVRLIAGQFELEFRSNHRLLGSQYFMPPFTAWYNSWHQTIRTPRRANEEADLLRCKWLIVMSSNDLLLSNHPHAVSKIRKNLWKI